MKENLFPGLEPMLTPHPGGQRESCAERQSFVDYRRSRPARRTAHRHAIYLSRIGELTAAQESVVTTTAEYLAVFFDLPVYPGAEFDPTTFRPWGVRQHPARGHTQLLTDYLLNEAMSLDRPEDALIWLAVTAWDLCSDDHPGGKWGSVFGEALSGHAGVWSLRYLGDPDGSDNAFRRCLKRSCAVAAHESLHVLGLDHCVDVPCNMRGSACLSGPLHLCPPCLRKLCWNRQVDLLPYLQRLRDFLDRRSLTESAGHYDSILRLLTGDGRMDSSQTAGPFTPTNPQYE
jgi:archaemetzincin